MLTNFLNGLFFGLGFFLALILLGIIAFFVYQYFDKIQYKKYYKEAFLRSAEPFMTQLEEQEQYLELQHFKNIIEDIKKGNVDFDYLSRHYEIVSENRYVVDENDESVKEITIEYIKKK